MALITYPFGLFAKRAPFFNSPKQIDRSSFESAENGLKNVLSGFVRQADRMKNGSYVDKTTSMYSILCAVFLLLFACLMCYLWVDAAKDRDNYKRYYEYFQQEQNAK